MEELKGLKIYVYSFEDLVPLEMVVGNSDHSFFLVFLLCFIFLIINNCIIFLNLKFNYDDTPGSPKTTSIKPQFPAFDMGKLGMNVAI